MPTIIGSILQSKSNNVNVVRDIPTYVYDESVAQKIRDAVDKPKAIGEILAKELDAPQNTKFYIKLAYQYLVATLFECLALTKEASNEGRIQTTCAQYFYGIVRKKKKI